MHLHNAQYEMMITPLRLFFLLFFFFVANGDWISLDFDSSHEQQEQQQQKLRKNIWMAPVPYASSFLLLLWIHAINAGTHRLTWCMMHSQIKQFFVGVVWHKKAWSHDWRYLHCIVGSNKNQSSFPLIAHHSFALVLYFPSHLSVSSFPVSHPRLHRSCVVEYLRLALSIQIEKKKLRAQFPHLHCVRRLISMFWPGAGHSILNVLQYFWSNNKYFIFNQLIWEKSIYLFFFFLLSFGHNWGINDEKFDINVKYRDSIISVRQTVSMFYIDTIWKRI